LFPEKKKTPCGKQEVCAPGAVSDYPVRFTIMIVVLLVIAVMMSQWRRRC